MGFFLSSIIYVRFYFFLFFRNAYNRYFDTYFYCGRFYCLMFSGEKEGLEREKRNLNIKCVFIFSTERGNISNYSMLTNNIWSFYPTTFKFYAIVNNVPLNSRGMHDHVSVHLLIYGIFHRKIAYRHYSYYTPNAVTIRI